MKSLAKSVSADNMVRQLILKLSSPKNRAKVVVWTEGKDWRIYRKFFDPEMIIEYGQGGCEQIVDGHHKLKDKVPSQKSIVIKDADFNRLEGEDLEADPNIFYTDGHDVEMMMMSHTKVQNGLCEGFEYDGDKDVFYDDVFNDLYFLSYFKWYDHHYKRCYAYGPLSKVQQSQANLCNLDWIEKKLHDCSKSKWEGSRHSTPFVPIDVDAVKEFIRTHTPVDKYEITNGHDYYNRLCLHIKNKLDYTRDEDQLKDSVIAYFDNEQFKQTKLHKSLRSWCDANVDILRKAI